MKRILLVDDEEDVRTLLLLVLKGAQYEVDTARSVTGAREFIRQRTYDLVITDWKLGGSGADGVAVADAAAAKGIKAVIVTGYAASIPAEVSARFEVLAKPFRNTELVAAAVRHIGPAE
jgi:DNA-binding NtrC family response regulator